MSSAPPPSDQSAQGDRGAQAPAAYPPTGAPQPGAPPGQQPYYPYAPPAGYAPPIGLQAQGGYYSPPPPGQYYVPPPAPGQYPYYNYYAQYAPPPGQYPPSSGQPGAPGAPGTAPADPAAAQAAQAATSPQHGAPPPGQYAPPAAPPPGGYYPPPLGGAYPMPAATPGFPLGGPAVPGHGLPPTHAGYPPLYLQGQSQDPLLYLGSAIPNPEAPPAAHGAQKVTGYDPAKDYNEIVKAISASDVGDEKKQFLSSSDNTSIANKTTPPSHNTRSPSPSPSKPQILLSVPSSSPLPSNSTSTPNSSSNSSLKPRPSSPSSSFLSRIATKLTLETNETKTVLRVLTALNIFQMDALNDYFVAKTGITLADRLDRCTSGNFGTAIRAVALGPLWFDVDLVHKSIVGLGTNETALIELILGRPGHEIRWLKKGYQLRYGRDLVSEIRADLSGKTEQMFVMALNTQKPADSPYVPPDQRQVEQDIESLHNASKKRDEITFCEILINRSDSHLAAVITGYSMRYKSLSKIIKKTFSGTMEEALLYIMHGVKPKRDRQGYWRDAKLLEKSMAGLGTKDTQLIYRIVRAHWSVVRMEAIKDAYKRRYGKTLEHRVKGETSGPYRDLLVALLKSSEGNH